MTTIFPAGERDYLHARLLIARRPGPRPDGRVRAPARR